LILISEFLSHAGAERSEEPGIHTPGQ